MEKWTSYHIYYHNVNEIDGLISDVIGPWMAALKKKNLCEHWFFIRYWSGGQHVRLRILNLKKKERKWLEDIKDYINLHPTESRSKLEDRRLFNEHMMKDTTEKWIPEGSIIPETYVRELLKYGGNDGVLLSEYYFYYSSMLAISLIKITKDEFSKRFVIAMDLMILTALGFGISNDNLIRFFKDYSRFWGRYLADPRKAQSDTTDYFQTNKTSIIRRVDDMLNFQEVYNMNRDRTVYRLYDLWYQQTNKISSEYLQLFERKGLINPQTGLTVVTEEEYWQAISSICLSHIHMMNNRLGIFLYDEFYLGTLLNYAMESIYKK